MSDINYRTNNKPGNPTAPYTTASHDTLIVVYHQNHDLLNISVNISHAKCRGVIVNPCLKDSSHNLYTFPVEYSHNILHYEQPFKNDTIKCVVIQFSSQYLYTDEGYYADVIRYGCKTVFNMKQNDKNVCEAKLQYLALFKRSNYVSLTYQLPNFNKSILEEIFEVHAFLFYSIITNSSVAMKYKQKYKCQENLANPPGFIKYQDKVLHKSEWYRGLRIYNISVNVSEYSNKIHTFQCSIQLVRSQEHTHDAVHIITGPLSESVTILTFTYYKCKISVPLQLPTGVTDLSSINNKKICLRKPVKGVIDGSMILELSLHTTGTNTKCTLGEITISSNLCLSRTWVSPLISRRGGFNDFQYRTCVPIK